MGIKSLEHRRAGTCPNSEGSFFDPIPRGMEQARSGKYQAFIRVIDGSWERRKTMA
jgi:hypothetical protein